MYSNHYIKIEDHDEIVKDSRSGAILTVDASANEEYLAKRAMIMGNKTAQAEINNLKEEMNTIKSDINEIKELLLRIASK